MGSEGVPSIYLRWVYTTIRFLRFVIRFLWDVSHIQRSITTD